MRDKEHVKDRRELHRSRIEVHTHDFRVPGVAGADLLISRIFHRTTRVSRNNFFHAWNSLQHSLHTPKTSTSHDDGLSGGGFGGLEIHKRKKGSGENEIATVHGGEFSAHLEGWQR
jgi:hypothetical protein